MLLPLLFAFADASPLPAPADTTRVTLSIAGAVAPEWSTYGASSARSNSSGTRGNGSASVTLYLWAPLVDDASPRSLQAFLQRTSFLEFDAGGQYLTQSYSIAAGAGDYTQEYVPFSGSTRVFVSPWLAVLGAVGANYLTDARHSVTAGPTTHEIWEPWGTLGVDARSGDASLTLQWQAVGIEEATTGTLSTAPGYFFPRFTLAGRIVIDRRYDLTTSAAVIPDGVAVRAGFAAYPTRDLGLSLFGLIQHGQIYWNTTTDYDSISGGPAVSWWVSPRANLSLSYTPQWVSWTQASEWEQTFQLGFTARVP